MYELYTVYSGEKTQILKSEDIVQIREAYALLKATQAPARISIDGRELTISKADEWCGSDCISRALLHCMAKSEGRYN